MFRDLDTTVTISLSSYKRQKLDLSHLSLEVNNKLNIYCLQAHFIKEKKPLSTLVVNYMSNISKSFFFGQAYDTELRSNQIIVIINIFFYAMKSEEHIGSLKIYSFQFVNLLLIMRRVARY